MARYALQFARWNPAEDEVPAELATTPPLAVIEDEEDEESGFRSYTRSMYETQRDLTKSAWQDPVVREYLLVAVIGGVISSAALARANQRLTMDESDDSARTVITAAVTALATGCLSIMWKLNQAAKSRTA